MQDVYLIVILQNFQIISITSPHPAVFNQNFIPKTAGFSCWAKLFALQLSLVAPTDVTSN